jgi:hypothetical protein
MSILSNYLKKIGAKSLDELSSEEQSTYHEWESALNGRQITDKEVRQFLETELENATISLITKTLGERDDIFLKMKVDFIRKITEFLDAPKREKEQIENLINNQT